MNHLTIRNTMTFCIFASLAIQADDLFLLPIVTEGKLDTQTRSGLLQYLCPAQSTAQAPGLDWQEYSESDATTVINQKLTLYNSCGIMHINAKNKPIVDRYGKKIETEYTECYTRFHNNVRTIERRTCYKQLAILSSISIICGSLLTFIP